MIAPSGSARFKVALLASAAMAFLAVTPSAAFIRATLSATDATPLRWDLEETLMPLPSVTGGEVIFVVDAAGSDNIPGPEEMNAVARAFQHWEGVGSSRVAFSRGADQSVQEANNDNINVVYWAEGSRTVIGGSNTNVDGFVSMTPVFSVASGANKGLILDANIILNGRQHPWTVTPDTLPTSYDVEAIVTHEVGHFIGLDHSGVLNATMSPRYITGEARQRVLDLDDLIGASEIYPDGNHLTVTGALAGLVGRPAPVFGALVTTEDASGGVVQQSITAANGAYQAPGLPSGSYENYVEPIDRIGGSATTLFDETDLGGVYSASVDPNFFASLPVVKSVAAPNTTTSSFSVGSTAPSINVSKVGGRASTLPAQVWRNAPTFLVAGESNILIGVAGPNINGFHALVITGPGITDNGLFSEGSVDGEPSIVHSYSVAVTAPPGLRSLRVDGGALGRTYAAGAIEIYPNLGMSLAAPSVYFAEPGEVNTGRLPGTIPLTLAARGNDVDMDWDDEPGAYGYNVYRGSLTSLFAAGLYDHQVIPGTVNGQCALSTSHTVLKGELLDPPPTYYLVTAYNNAGEGIIGRDSNTVLLPPASPACPTP